MKYTVLLYGLAFLTSGHIEANSEKPVFATPTQLKVGGEPISARKGYMFPSFVDLNSDGLTDLIVGTYDGPSHIYFYKNRGKITAPKYAVRKLIEAGGKALRVPGIGP